MLRNVTATPTRKEAEGMIAGLLAYRPDPSLPHPYGSLNLDDPADRRLIQRVYASSVRLTMGTF